MEHKVTTEGSQTSVKVNVEAKAENTKGEAGVAFGVTADIQKNGTLPGKAIYSSRSVKEPNRFAAP